MSNPKQTPQRMWELKQRAEDAGTLDLHIYGEVEGDSRDFWTGDLIRSETSANAFRDALAEHQQLRRQRI